MKNQSVIAKDRLESVREYVAPLSEARPDRRIAWEWNIPLLIKAAVSAFVVVSGLTALYYFQSSRIVDSIIKKADLARESGDAAEEIKWLKRYVALVPKDQDGLIKLALATDDSVASINDIDSARQRLMSALASCGDSVAQLEVAADLRRRLIPRLLQRGKYWASEAENQVMQLNAPREDPDACKWLAQALVLQRAGSQYLDRQPTEGDEENDYWRSLANQPTGEVVYRAVQFNPTDVNVLASFLAIARSTPEWFVQPGQEVPASVSLRVESVKEMLKDIEDDGQAAYVLSKNLKDADEELAFAQRETPRALERIRRNMPKAPEQSEGDSSNSEMQTLAGSLDLIEDPAEYQPRWDWQLCLDGAALIASTDPMLAREFIRNLLKFDGPQVPREQREAVYKQYGLGLAAEGDNEGAIQAWTEGSEALDGSLELLAAKALLLASLGEIERGTLAVREYQVLVEGFKRRLDMSDLGSRDKQPLRERLAYAEWEISLLDGQLAAASTRLLEACATLEKVFNSPLLLPPERRVQAGRLLGECYRERQLWDMAAQVYEKCITLTPDEQGLRWAAAECWRNVGATERALQHLSLVKNMSYETAVEAARLRALTEAAKPGDRKDLFALSESIREARERFDQASPELQSRLPAWKLELLELNFEALEKGGAKDFQEPMLDRLSQIADANPSIAEVQLQAVNRFAAAGRLEAAELAVERLQTTASESGLPVDAANAALARASLLVQNGEIDQAVEILKSAAEEIAPHALLLTKAASDVLIRSQRYDDAYGLLSSLPDSEFDTATLMSVHGLCRGLKSTGAGGRDWDAEMARWKTKLRELEGQDGTHWRFLEAEALIAEAGNSPKQRELLDTAERLLEEIDRRRPRWGRAGTLSARIASLRGFSDEAVRLYRNAIRDGDQQPSTGLALVSELMSQKKLEQAQEVLQGMQGAEAAASASSLAGAFARQGDMNQALSMARDLVKNNPNDFNNWILLARMLVLAEFENEQQKTASIEEAWQALEKANELAEGKQPTVWQARLQHKMFVEGASRAAEQIELAAASPMPTVTRLLFVGRAYLQLENFGKARENLLAALQVDPKSTEAHLLLADLYRRSGDADASMVELRLAQQSAPENQQLREQLALYLASSNSAQSPEVWAEIDGLLQDAGETQRSHLLGAIIDLQKGDETRKSRALGILEQYSRLSSPLAADAKRMLAGHYVNKWKESTDPQAGRRFFFDAVSLYESLLDGPTVNGIDAIKLTVMYLLSSQRESAAGDEEAASVRLSDAERVVRRLESTAGNTLLSLQLRIRIAVAQGRQADIMNITQDWEKGVANVQAIGQEVVWDLTGRTLYDLGFAKESIPWLERAYNLNPQKYRPFAVALASTSQLNRAAEVCVQEYQREPSAESIVLLCEASLMESNPKLPAAAEDVINDALVRFTDSAALLEAVGNLRLMQARNLEASQLFERSLAIAPDNYRVLNNLAMALSLLPGRKPAALTSIQRAIEVRSKESAGKEEPELLDTLGIVQLRAGDLDGARKSLEEAIALRADPRFQIHLAQVLLKQNDMEQLNKLWPSLANLQLDELALMSDDLEALAEIRAQLN